MKKTLSLILALFVSILISAVLLTACNNGSESDNKTPTPPSDESGTTESDTPESDTPESDTTEELLAYDEFKTIVDSASNLSVIRYTVNSVSAMGVLAPYDYETKVASRDGDKIRIEREYYYSFDPESKIKDVEYSFVEDDCRYILNGINYKIDILGSVTFLPDGQYQVTDKSKCQVKYSDYVGIDTFLNEMVRLIKEDDNGLIAFDVEEIGNNYSGTLSDVSLTRADNKIVLSFKAADDNNTKNVTYTLDFGGTTTVSVPNEYKAETYPWKAEIDYNGVSYELSTDSDGNEIYEVVNTPASDDLVEKTVNGLPVKYDNGGSDNPPPVTPDPPKDLDSFIAEQENYRFEQVYTQTAVDGSVITERLEVSVSKDAIVMANVYISENTQDAVAGSEYIYAFVYQEQLYVMTVYDYNPAPEMDFATIQVDGKTMYVLSNEIYPMSLYHEFFDGDTYTQSITDYMNGTPKYNGMPVSDLCGTDVGEPAVEFDLVRLDVTYSVNIADGSTVTTSVSKYNVTTNTVDIPDALYQLTEYSIPHGQIA